MAHKASPRFDDSGNIYPHNSKLECCGRKEIIILDISTIDNNVIVDKDQGDWNQPNF